MNTVRYERVYAEVSLDNLHYNFENIKNAVNPKAKLMAVIKTDGYGHGAIPIAKELSKDERLYGFAVATADEAFILRKAGITKDILILGYTFPSDYEEMVRENISFTVFKEDMAREISDDACRLSSEGKEYKAKIHLKLDTGMGRIGIIPSKESIPFVKMLLSLPGISLTGMFSHFAKADEEDHEPTRVQFDKYIGFAELIKKELDYDIPIKHICNSAGIIEFPEYNLDMARAGIILYGLWPSSEVSKEKVKLKPLLSLYSKIVYIKEIKEETGISYGGTFKAKPGMKVATVPVGYGDGYPRMLSNKGYVLVKGRKCPILGRVCMDQFMIDVSSVDAHEGDRVTLIGKDGDETITMEDLGELSGRFNYELACDLGKRIPRVYILNGEVVLTKDYNNDF